MIEESCEVQTNDRSVWKPELGRDVAWIVGAGDVVFYAYGEAGMFSNAVVRLVHGVHVLFGEEHLRILRRRIFVNHDLDLATRGVIKVLANRCSVVSDHAEISVSCSRAIDVGQSLKLDGAAVRQVRAERIDDNEARAWVDDEALSVEQSHADRKRFAKARSVAALLRDDHGMVVAAAVNSNATEKMRHAEVNVLLASGLPRARDGMTIFVSLTPCPMCAGFILQWIGGAKVRVVVTHEDPGPCGKHAILKDYID